MRLAESTEATSFLRLLTALRNVLAHGSDGSGTRFNEACRAKARDQGFGLAGEVNDPLKRDKHDVRDIGRYLRAPPAGGGVERIQLLHERVKTCSEMLRK